MTTEFGPGSLDRNPMIVKGLFRPRDIPGISFWSAMISQQAVKRARTKKTQPFHDRQRLAQPICENILSFHRKYFLFYALQMGRVQRPGLHPVAASPQKTMAPTAKPVTARLILRFGRLLVFSHQHAPRRITWRIWWSPWSPSSPLKKQHTFIFHGSTRLNHVKHP